MLFSFAKSFIYFKFTQQELNFLANLNKKITDESHGEIFHEKLNNLLNDFKSLEKNECGNWCCKTSILTKPETRTRIGKKTESQTYGEFYVVECPLWSTEGCPMYRIAYG